MKIWYVDFDETRMKLEAFQPVPYGYKDEQILKKLIIQFTNDLFKEMSHDPISDFIFTLRLMKNDCSQKVTSKFINASHYTLKSVPIDWNVSGCEKIETVRVFGEPRQFLTAFYIDILFNNWYVQTFTFPICGELLFRQFIHYIQLRYGFYDNEIRFDDILDAMTIAAEKNGSNMNMQWLKKYITETTNMDHVHRLFDILNYDTMAPEFMELKIMCLNRLGGINHNGQIELY